MLKLVLEEKKKLVFVDLFLDKNHFSFDIVNLFSDDKNRLKILSNPPNSPN